MSLLVAHALVWMPVAAVVAVLMDVWAAFLHGRVWHAWLWSVHRSHHAPRTGMFEKNDAFSLLHAPVAVALIVHGCVGHPGPWREVAYGVGMGMTLFGVAYLVVHDGLVHGRLPVSSIARVRYVRRIVRAHRVHHAGIHGGVPYGFFTGPWELARHENRRGRRSGMTRPTRPQL